MAYSGLQSALNVQTPYELDSGLAELQDKQADARSRATGATLAAATLPTDIAAAKSKLQGLDLGNQRSALELDSGRIAIQQQQQAAQRNDIAMALATNPDLADAQAAMEKLGASGNPEAGLIARRGLTEDARNRLASIYAAPNPTAAVTAANSPTIPPPTPEVIAKIQAQIANLSPDKVVEAAQHAEATRQALDRVAQAKDPTAQWALEAPALTIPGQPLVPYSKDNLNSYRQHETAVSDALRTRTADAAGGLPAPKTPAEVIAHNGVLWEIDRSDPANPTVKPLSPLTKDYGADDDSGSPSGGAAITPDEFATRIMGAENSTGDPAAKNPRSSAAGNGQFIDSTWLRMMRANRPDLTEGKTPDQIIAMKSDPALSAQMTTAYAVENGVGLASAGQPVTATTLALAHRFGLGDAEKILGSAPSTPLSQVLSSQVLRANPGLDKQTAGAYVANLAQKVGIEPVKIASLPSGEAGQTVGDLAGAPATSEVHGPDYLKSLPSTMATQVQALAEGRMQFPSSYALSKPYWQKMLTAVAQYDPAFNQSDYNARSKTRAAFTSGQEGRNITSYNTVIGHLDQMDHAIDSLGNTPFTWWNKPAQWLGTNVGDAHTQGAISNFNTVKGAVTSELVKALRGSGGAEADIQYWMKRFDQADSPVALHAAVKEAASLLGSRIDALTDQYNTGMGTAAKTPPGLSPTAAKSLSRLQGGTGAEASVAAPPPAGQRVLGQTYQSPKGPVIWTAHGWVMADAAH